MKLSSTRQKLADAITHVSDCERQLTLAIAALASAKDKEYEADEAIASAQERLAGVKPDVGKYINGFQSGTPADIGLLDSPRQNIETELAAAERSLKTWKELQVGLEVEIQLKSDAITKAKVDRQRAIRDVLLDEAPIAKLVDGLADMEREVIERRIALAFLRSQGLIPATLEAQVETALYDYGGIYIPFPTKSYKPEGYDKSAVVQKWSAVIRNLEVDASTPLP